MSNLVSQGQRPKAERVEIARAGGIASGKARRKNADLVTALKALLESDFTAEDGSTQTGAEIIAARLFKLATEEGNIAAIKEIFDRIHGKAEKTLNVSAGPKTETPGYDLSKVPLENLLKIRELLTGEPLPGSKSMFEDKQ